MIDKTTVSAPKVRVCLPCSNHGAIHPRTLASVEALKRCRDLRVEVVKAQGASISLLRNGAVTGGSHRIKQSGFEWDYYLSLDADIEFTVADVLALIKRDVPIVGGAYAMRGRDGSLAAGTLDMVTAECRYMHDDAEGMIEIDWIGAGFVLIKREVFEDMEYPYYREEVIHYIDSSGEPCAYWVTEASGFCMGARRAGYKVFVDCDVRVKHHLNFTGGSTMTTQESVANDMIRMWQENKAQAEKAAEVAKAEFEKQVRIAIELGAAIAGQEAVQKRIAEMAAADSADAIAADINADAEAVIADAPETKQTKPQRR